MLATESEPQPRTGARLGQPEVGAAEQPTSAAASHTTEVLTTTVAVAQGRVCRSLEQVGCRANQPVLPATWPGPARLSWQAEHTEG